ncbi:hypothetical protein BU17DRAFT_67552 [Hysterangium stoloniferum]|nr:hypothetical protein BU17DRAFT_67552 [Hysterangium stoloniferum]
MATGEKRKSSLPTIPISPNPFNDHASPQPHPQKLVPKSTVRKSLVEEGVYPDDLFVKYTIAEIKGIQARLRVDADAKQEELRLMVGERYRDLLQASTSIISIAGSSRRVVDALAQMREAVVPSHQTQRKPRSSTARGKDDAHLKALQSLSAHIKLLLDAPEHMWRLLEKKHFLQAAWLFLLTRVVHRALVAEDPEEAVWLREGINVQTQFPLVQRQWDTVSQFRPQIAHRATQYLRESSTTAETACSTILTLHLLDSLPLVETLSTLLSQRLRTLNALLARNLEFRSPSRPGSPILRSQAKPQMSTPDALAASKTVSVMETRRRKNAVRDVREALLEVLHVICGTMRITRDIFHPDKNQGLSLVEQSLQQMQCSTPTETTITTSSLLSTLPSSTHLLTLPPSILSYKPYIDLTSPSTHVDPSVLDTKLSSWFDKATRGLKGRVQAWLAGLENIREVWNLRRKLLEKLQTNEGLDDPEKTQIESLIDTGVQVRIVELTNTALEKLESCLDETLRATVQDIKKGTAGSRFDTMPPSFMFSAPPLPSLSQASDSLENPVSPFKQFKGALRQRVDGRSPLLDRVLTIIEGKASEIEDDLNVMNDDQPCALRDKIMTSYYAAIESSSSRISEILQIIMTEQFTDGDVETDTVVNITVFLGRVCYVLSDSPHAKRLRYPQTNVEALRQALLGLHKQSMDRWRSHVISKATDFYDPIISSLSQPSTTMDFIWPSLPSSELMSSLLFIISSLDSLGLSRTELINQGTVQTTMHDLCSSLAMGVPTEKVAWGREPAHLLWDLIFLQKCLSPSVGKSPTTDNFENMATFCSNLQSVAPEGVFPALLDHIDHTIKQFLLRSQTLLAPLVAEDLSQQNGHENGHAGAAAKIKSTPLLPFGVPSADQDYRAAVETVKPSARFGLLLVGSTAVR